MIGNFVLGGFKGLTGMNSFHPTRFEDLMARRGWVPVMWEKALKCPCYSENTGNPDPNCPVCGGIGYIYSEDLNVEVVGEQLTINANGQSIYALNASLDGSPDPSRTVSQVSRAYNLTTHVTYTVAILGVQITLSGGVLPVMGDKVLVDYVFTRDPGPSIKGIITNVDYQRDYIPSGEWLQGDSIMTVSGQYRMGFRDRITIQEQVVRTDELKRRFDVTVGGLSLERLRYKTGIKVVSCRDLLRSFTLGVDFTLGPDMTIVWAGGAVPSHNAFTLKYTGNATSATLVVTASAITVILVGQTDGSLNLNVPFATYPTLADVLTYVKTQAGYEIETTAQSSISGVDNAERMSYSVPVPATSIKNVAVMVRNQDKTQYTIEYMHYLAFSIYMRQGMVRRPDAGGVLPGKYWLRLWENTDLFSNKHGS